jgi:dipeptidyl aminopeptidase/acylaminoacyl peptidase
MSALTRIGSRVTLAVAALLTAGALPVWGQSPAGDVLTPHSVERLRNVGRVTVSPDGRRVAYSVSVPRDPFNEDDGPAWSHLYIYDLEAETTHLYVGGDVNVTGLAWTPGSEAVTYLAKRAGDEVRALYMIPLGGGESSRLLEHETDIDSYTLSPDAKQVAFLATDPEPERRHELRKLGFKAEAYEEDARYTRVWVADVSPELGLVGADSPRLLAVQGNASELHWAPVGSKLVVALAPTPLVDDHYMYRRLRVLDAGTGEVVAAIENPGKLGSVAWSPDGQHMVFISAQTINDPEEGRLVVVDASGGEIRDLVPGFEGHFVTAAWKDDQTVLYLANEGVETTVGEIRQDGTRRSTIVEAGGPILGSLSLSADGRTMAFAGESPAHPFELFVLDDGDRVPLRATNSNPWLDRVRLASQEVVRWTARDGLEIEGLLIRPLDEAAGRRYPLVVYVHGGPEAHSRNGWLTSYSRPGQVAAAREIAVLYPNYRASTGRGVEFSMLDHADMGGREFDDIVDGVDHLIEAGLVDPDRVGVTGGSYGGYATAWLSTYYSDRFAAGVMRVGISNQISKVGTTDIPDEMFLVHNRLRPWDDWELFLERSPIAWAHQSRTPLLIMHGTEDKRVNPGQSLEMYRHLKLRGQAPVRLIFFPGEGHGNRNAAARLESNLRTMRWLEHYLLGPGGEMPDRDLDPTEATGDAATAAWERGSSRRASSQ